MTQEIFRPSIQIPLAIEVQLNMPPGLLAKIVECCFCRGDANQFLQKVRQRISLIEKSSLPGGDQLGYSGDRRRQNNSLHRHGLHQRQRNSFAVAGEHYDIGLAVECSQFGAPNVATEFDLILHAHFPNEIVQTLSLFTLAGDYAVELQTSNFQFVAGADEKLMIFDRVQASYA